MAGKKIRALALAGILATSLLPTPAYAKHISGSSDWHVTYTEGGRIEDNYSESGVEADIRKLQPGDDLTITVELRHEGKASADWYLSNEVLKSLEAGDATGSGYGYVLAYEGSGGSREIYRSSTVGGTGSAGLLEATPTLDDYFYLDTLSTGGRGKVTLTVSLDGETEQNAYFNQFARIRLSFAAEERKVPVPSTGSESEGGGDASGTADAGARSIVKTGEETNLLPLYVTMLASGTGLAAFVLVDIRKRRGES